MMSSLPWSGVELSSPGFAIECLGPVWADVLGPVLTPTPSVQSASILPGPGNVGFSDSV